MYKQDPKSKTDIIQKYVISGLEAFGHLDQELDRSRLIPVIKDRPWLEETRKALLTRGAKEAPENIYEDFNTDLVIVYAIDSPKSIRYLTPADLKKLQIERTELRHLACENLTHLLTNIQYRGTNGLYMIIAGGDYEASLLLLDSIWKKGPMDIKGTLKGISSLPSPPGICCWSPGPRNPTELRD